MKKSLWAAGILLALVLVGFNFVPKQKEGNPILHEKPPISPTRMEVKAFRMKLKPGYAEEYRRRHDAIWPELVDLLRQSGIVEYHIFLDEESLSLFAFQKKSSAAPAESLAQHPVMRRWWTHMADLMEVNADQSPVVVPCPELFRL